MLGKGFVNVFLSKGVWQTGTGRGEGLCDLSWVQQARTSREAVAARWDQRIPSSPAAGSRDPGAMFLGDAAGVGTDRADTDGPEHRSRFRKGFPARGEGAVRGARAEGVWGALGEPKDLAEVMDDGPSGCASHRGASATGPPPPRRKFANCLGAGGSGAGAAPAELLLRGRAWAGGAGREPPAPECRGWGRSERRSCRGAPRRRSPRHRCGRPGHGAGALPP